MTLDDCGYYILIPAGDYGSPYIDGVGFTEEGYDYAVATHIPVMSFVIKGLNLLEPT